MSGLQLCEYFYPEYDATWEAAKLCGVERAVMRLPEEPSFDFTNEAHWETVVNRLNSRGLRPVVLEPLPNRLHDEIKRGGPNAEQCLEQAAKMLRVMDRFHIRCLCFNFMAGVGWTRTSRTIPERGNKVYPMSRTTLGVQVQKPEVLWYNDIALPAGRIGQR